MFKISAVSLGVFLVLGCAHQPHLSYTEDDLYYTATPVLTYNPKPVENAFSESSTAKDTWYDEATAAQMRPDYRRRLSMGTSEDESSEVIYPYGGATGSVMGSPGGWGMSSGVSMGVGVGMGMGYYPGMYAPYGGGYNPYAAGYYPYGLWGAGPGGTAPNLYYLNTRRPGATHPSTFRPDPSSLPRFNPGRPDVGTPSNGNPNYRTRENGAEPPAWFNNSSRMGGTPKSRPTERVIGVPRR
jgi:hypothetical protein